MLSHPVGDESIDDLLGANERYAAEFSLEQGMLPAPPRKGLAIVSCMDARIRVHTMLGLTEGDAHVIRNAGGVVTDDTIRSLAISQRRLDTRGVMVIQHTRCGMSGLDEAELREELERDAGQAPDWPIGAFADLDQSVRESVERLRTSDYLIHRDAIRGFVYDVESGRLREVL
jgi:carbonic anhydrase